MSNSIKVYCPVCKKELFDSKFEYVKDSDLITEFCCGYMHNIVIENRELKALVSFGEKEKNFKFIVEQK